MCPRQALTRGYCKRHYQRLHRYGDPLGGARAHLPETLDERFWSRVERTEHGLIWVGTTKMIRNLTYGVIGFQGVSHYAHRISYELHHGPIPEGDYVVDHQPDCPKVCVTPEHLTLFTRGDHTKVGWKRGEITGDRART